MASWYPKSEVAMGKRDQLWCNGEGGWENQPVHYLTLTYEAMALSFGVWGCLHWVRQRPSPYTCSGKDNKSQTTAGAKTAASNKVSNFLVKMELPLGGEGQR